MNYKIQITLYHPRSLKLHRYDAKTVPESFKALRCEALGHDVGILLVGRHMEDAELVGLHPFPNEVDVEFDVLGPFMMHGVGAHVDCRYIVAVGHRCLVKVAVKLTEELA